MGCAPRPNRLSLFLLVMKNLLYCHLGDGGSNVSGTFVGSVPDRRRHENPSQPSSVPGATCGCVLRPLGLIWNHWAGLHRRL